MFSWVVAKIYAFIKASKSHSPYRGHVQLLGWKVAWGTGEGLEVIISLLKQGTMLEWLFALP